MNELSAAQAFPATGETTSFTAGDDGAIRAGAPLSYTDNGDGTITDNNTKLVWEKKDEGGTGDLHDVNNFYTWAGTCSVSGAACGTDANCGTSGGTCNAGGPMTIFQWVAQLNTAGFAGHTDWSVPNVKELESIVDFQNFNPAVATAFNTSCSTGCTFDGAGGTTECSCTGTLVSYASATNEGVGNPFSAWDVGFSFGAVLPGSKADPLCVRAVRGGL